jgi:hypothetical protein
MGIVLGQTMPEHRSHSCRSRVFACWLHDLGGNSRF